MVKSMSKWHSYFMDLAERTAQLSKATRAKVGCVIVRDKRVVVTGFNGLPAGLEGPCEEGDITSPFCIHSEANAILYAAREGIPLIGTTLYCLYSPCVSCACMLYSVGVKEVYYKHEYRNTEGLTFLKNNGIVVERLED